MTLNNVPLASQTLANTQPTILANFQTIDAAFLVDHVPYVTAGQGKHNKITFPRQAVSPTTGATEMALFSRLSTLSGVTELALRRESNGAVTEFTSCLATANGWTRLPSGILLKWGTVAGATALHTTTFPVAATIPVYTNCFCVLVTTAYNNLDDVSGNAFVRLVDWTNTQLRVYVSPRVTLGAGTCSFTYLALGV